MNKNKSAKKTVVFGLYDKFGYEVYSNDEQVYSAGNHPYDSQQPAAPGRALPLNAIRKFCVQTSKEIAKELHATYTGVDER